MKSILLILLISAASVVKSQVGELFPTMEAENLSEHALNMPEDLKGKYAIIGLAYSKKSEKALQSWFGPVFNQFMREPDKNNLFTTNYDINLYFVPMITGHKTAIYKSVLHKVQETIDRELHPHVLFYKGSIKAYKSALSLKKDVPHFFLLDDTGKIIWRTSGFYSAEKLQEIVDHLDEALGEW